MKGASCTLMVFSVAVMVARGTSFHTETILERDENGTFERKLPREVTVSHVSPNAASRNGKVFANSYQFAGQSSKKMHLRSQPPQDSPSINTLTQNTPSTPANGTIGSQKSPRGRLSHSLFATVLPYNTTIVTKHGGASTSQFLFHVETLSMTDTGITSSFRYRLQGEQNTHVSTVSAGTTDGSTKQNGKTQPPTPQRHYEQSTRHTEIKPGTPRTVLPVLPSQTGSRLQIDTEFLVNCLKTLSEVALPPLDGQLVLDINSTRVTEELNAHLTCYMSLTPPPGKVLLMEFGEGDPDMFFSVMETKDSKRSIGPEMEKYLVGTYNFIPGWNRRAYSFPGRTVWFELNTMEGEPVTHINPIALNFTWVNDTLVPGLETVFTSPTAGFKSCDIL